MQNQQNAQRKARTRMMVQCGGLLQKSGLLEVFHITPGDDLQAYENRQKAAQLLGFLVECFEEKSFDQDQLERWEAQGERLLKYG